MYLMVPIDGASKVRCQVGARVPGASKSIFSSEFQ
jgi:hypothetical protein